MNLTHPVEDLFGRNVARVIERLYMAEGGLTGRSIATLSDTPLGSTQRALIQLQTIGLVRSRTVGRSGLYTLNRGHLLWQAVDVAMRSRDTLERRLADVTEAVVGGSTSVLLYGSQARDTATSASDVDLLIVWDTAVDVVDREKLLAELSSEVLELTGNDAQIVDLTSDDLKRLVSQNDPLVASWRRDSRALSGPDFNALMRVAAA